MSGESQSTEADVPCTCGHREAQHHMGHGWCCAPVGGGKTCACDLYEPARRAPQAVIQDAARKAAALCDETREQVQASPVGSIERRLHSALGDLAHVVLSPGATS